MLGARDQPVRHLLSPLEFMRPESRSERKGDAGDMAFRPGDERVFGRDEKDEDATRGEEEADAHHH